MEFIDKAIACGATDVHIEADGQAVMRQLGELVALGPCTKARFETLFQALYKKRTFFDSIVENEDTKVKDFSLSLESGERLRVRRYQTRGRAALAIRFLPRTVPELGDLAWPEAIYHFARLRSGLVLVTGPTGSGKSTTLAALMTQIAKARACHIITYESPIEYIIEGERALVHQRQVPEDAISFAQGAQEAMRLDPDVVMLGELVEKEAMQAALRLAESGHLVLATMHAASSSDAVRYLLNHFDGRERQMVTEQLAQCLRGVVTQRLLANEEKTQLLPVYEILLANSAVKNIIRTDGLVQLASAIENGRSEGMISLEESLARLVQRRALSLAVAKDNANSLPLLERWL